MQSNSNVSLQYMPANSLSSSTAKHVFVIDDDVSMRATLSELLSFAGYQVHLFDSPVEFLKTSIQVAPTVIITDMRMPGMSGVELQSELLQRGRNIPIIFISGESTVAQSVSAMQLGAIEFLIKPFERDALLMAVVRGLGIDARNMRIQIERANFEESLKTLSPREQEVFYLLAQGFSNAELMEKLQISLPTAKQYKSEVMRKLNLRSLSQLIALNNQRLV